MDVTENTLNPFLAAAELLQEHRNAVARAVARQIKSTVPMYEYVDEEAITGNVKDVMDGVRILLTKGDERQTMGVLNVIMEIRQISGFSVGDFLVAVLCALPVLRRFFIWKADSPTEGLSIYEAFESLVLPLYGRIVINFMRLAESSDTFPEGMPPISAIMGEGEEMSGPFEIVRVEEGD